MSVMTRAAAIKLKSQDTANRSWGKTETGQGILVITLDEVTVVIIQDHSERGVAPMLTWAYLSWLSG